MEDRRYPRQVELEQESTGMGIHRYREQRKSRDESDMPPGIQLMQSIIDPLSAAVQEWVTLVDQGKAQKNGKLVKYVSAFDPDVVAFLTSKVIINAMTKGESTQAVALAVTGLLEDEAQFQRFREENERLYNTVDHSLRKATSYRHKRTILKRMAKWSGVTQENWSHADRVRLGMHLLDMFESTTGLVTRINKPAHGSTKGISIVIGTEKAQDWFARAHDRCEILQPYYLPTIIPPKAWTSTRDGGYHTGAMGRLKLMKTRNTRYLEELDQHPGMEQVYRALNILQDTPWRINSRVLDVMDAAWQAGGGLKWGMASAEDQELPPCPVCGVVPSRTGDHKCFDLNPEQHKVWKSLAAQVHEANARLRSKRLAVIQHLMIGRKFKDEEAIYFPYTMDWRGRVYPVPIYVTPQGDDIAKGLLQFAEGKPLTDEGFRWLCIHTANVYGEDKISLDERVRWVEDHREQIIEAAENPLDGTKWWTEADKPYQFLAACIDLAGYWRDPENHVSYTPVAMDGSCNGLQNFSAMLLDDVGGPAVNLTPTDRPQDIYTQVAEVVTERVERAALDGDEWALKVRGKINRKLVKRNVMTLPYGVTRRGMAQQLVEETTKWMDEGHPLVDDPKDLWKACQYLSTEIYDAVGTVVVAARQAMDWLRDTAREVAKVNLPIRWVTPVGLPVLQDYRVLTRKRLDCTVGGLRIRMTYKETQPKIDRRKQSQGIAPNFVHSLDASHMMSTVLRAADQGLTHFGMVHDSYATLASDAPILARTLREAFVAMYSDDVLYNFREQLLDQVPPKLQQLIPELPPKGTLDLTQVLDSPYFFA